MSNIEKFERLQEDMKKGAHAGIQIGWACPKCRVFLKEQPDQHMPVCTNPQIHKTPLTYQEVMYIENHKERTFISLEFTGKEMKNVIRALVDNLNDAWGWILNHSHSRIDTSASSIFGSEEE